MKIDELTQQSVAAYVGAVRKEKQPETSDSHSEGPVKQQSGADKVELSSYIPVEPSRKRAEQAVKPNRVEDLKARIADGSYSVPAMAVAEKMLANVKGGSDS